MGFCQNQSPAEIWCHQEMERLWREQQITSHISLLQVEQQKDKKRLIYNAQYLNCFMESPKFSLEGVQKVSHLAPQPEKRLQKML